MARSLAELVLDRVRSNRGHHERDDSAILLRSICEPGLLGAIQLQEVVDLSRTAGLRRVL
jgi:hypothetical protein